MLQWSIWKSNTPSWKWKHFSNLKLMVKILPGLIHEIWAIRRHSQVDRLFRIVCNLVSLFKRSYSKPYSEQWSLDLRQIVSLQFRPLVRIASRICHGENCLFSLHSNDCLWFFCWTHRLPRQPSSSSLLNTLRSSSND